MCYTEYKTKGHHREDEMKLNEEIRRLRKMRGLTQEQLAEAMGVSNVSVSKWENGQSAPELTMLAALADYFEVSVDALLGHTVTGGQHKMLLEKLRHLNREKRYDEAQALAGELLRRYPNHKETVSVCTEVYYCLAVTREDGDAGAKAITLTKRELALQGSDDADGAVRRKLWNRLGSLYRMQGNTEAALACYRAGNAGGENSLEIGLCLMDQNKKEDALSVLSEVAMDHVWELFFAVCAMGDCLSDAGKQEEAVRLLHWGQGMLTGLAKTPGSCILKLRAILYAAAAAQEQAMGLSAQAQESRQKAMECLNAYEAAPDDSMNSVNFYYGKKQFMIDNIDAAKLKTIYGGEN